MKTLPRNAQLILILTYLAGLAGIVLFAPLARPHDRLQAIHLGIVLLFSILFSRKKIALGGKPGEPKVTSLSLGFVLTFVALLSFGPGGGVVVAVLSMAAGCLYPYRQPWHQFCFNVGLASAETAAAGWLFLTMNGGLELGRLTAFPAVLCAGTLYYIINTAAVASIMAATSDQKIVDVWKENFIWMVPGQFAGTCIAALTVHLVESRSLSLLLFATPLVALIYNSFAVHVTRADEKRQHVAHLADLYLSTIKTLAKTLALAVDAKDPHTHSHVLRVQRCALAIAARLGLEGDELEALNTGALLHDIGKIGIPDSILLKPGRLTESEFAMIREHPTMGAQILGPVEFPWPVLPVVKSHHEKWDGTGYPSGLAGEDIPLTARIVAVADVYDALTSNRAYRSAWTPEDALAEIVRTSGTHFDPAIVDAFVAIWAEMGADDDLAALPAFSEPLAKAA